MEAVQLKKKTENFNARDFVVFLDVSVLEYAAQSVSKRYITQRLMLYYPAGTKKVVVL
jgi:hypothetical protein